MKTFKSSWLVGSLAAGVLALGSQGVYAQATSIKGSQHDFTTNGGAQQKTSGSAEICAFCHTPHAADATFIGAPLWNKDASGATYTRYSALQTSSLDGGELAVGSVSLACLSCHDGTQAMDVVVNEPGQDLGDGDYTADVGAMTNTASSVNQIAMLGTDLRNDHPVSIVYGGLASTSWPSGTANTALTWGVTVNGGAADPDFIGPEAAIKNDNTVWYFDASDNNRVDKQEIRLYARGANGAGYVECGSCHDPHNTNDNYAPGAGDAEGDVVDFLRMSNANSAICLTCHDK